MRRVSAVSTSSAENGSSISSKVGSLTMRPGKANPLAHAARKLARVGGLKAVEADQIDRRHRAAAHLVRRQPERVEAELHILEDGEPRIQREGLEHHGDALGGAGNRRPTIEHLAARSA